MAIKSRLLGKLMKEGLLSSGQCSNIRVLGINGCCAWLYQWFGWLCSLFYWSNYHLFPKMKNRCQGISIIVIMLYLLLINLSINRMKCSSPMGSKDCNTDRKSVSPTRGTVLKSKLHFVTFHESIWVCLWTLPSVGARIWITLPVLLDNEIWNNECARDRNRTYEPLRNPFHSPISAFTNFGDETFLLTRNIVG